MTRHIITLAVIMSAGLGAPAFANDAKTDLVDVGNAITSSLEPESPTFQIIGVSTDDVSRPSSPGKLAVSLLNSLDQNGNFQSGLAVEFRPYLLFRQSELRLSEYKSNAMIRQLSNIQVAIGVAKGSEKTDPSVKAALGFIWTPINGLDQNRASALSKCLEGAVGGPLGPDIAPEAAQAKKDGQKAELAACYKYHPLLPDNTTKLQLNFSPLFVSPTGKTSALKSKGFHAGAVFSLGLTKTATLVADPKATRSLLVFAASYRKKELTPDPATEGSFLDRNRLSVGARAIFGRPDFALLSFQAFHQRAKYNNGERDNYATFVAGVDVRIAEKMWLNLSTGSSSGRSFGGNSTFAGAGFKFGFGQSTTSRSGFDQ
jgi:hypothetical protein